MDNAVSKITKEDIYNPSEILNIFKNFLTLKEVNHTVLCLRGIYFKTDKIYAYKNVAYDKLKDESSAEEITIIVPLSLREELKNGNLVSVYGVLNRKLTSGGCIQILFQVSRINKIKEVVISEDEQKRIEYRRLKEQLGYKNVDNILEAKLFIGLRPHVAIIYADTSIVDADFNKGLVAAKMYIDFNEYRVSFANIIALRTLLVRLDAEKYDIIALVRGGGSGLENLDSPELVEVLANLKTAWIYGVGHEKENLFIRNIADKVISIPFALGTYFRDITDTVMEKKKNSRAALIKEIEEQYIKQIEDSKKEKIELTKQLDSSRKQNKEQYDAAEKRNKELQERLDKQGKTLTDIQNQEKLRFSNYTAQTNALNREKMQLSQELRASQDKVKSLEKQLGEKNTGCAMPGCLGMVVIIIVSIISFSFIII